MRHPGLCMPMGSTTYTVIAISTKTGDAMVTKNLDAESDCCRHVRKQRGLNSYLLHTSRIVKFVTELARSFVRKAWKHALHVYILICAV